MSTPRSKYGNTLCFVANVTKLAINTTLIKKEPILPHFYPLTSGLNLGKYYTFGVFRNSAIRQKFLGKLRENFLEKV